MALDSTSLVNLLALFPELHKELDLTFKDVISRITKPGFQHSKERVFIAEAFFNKKPDLAENDQREWTLENINEAVQKSRDIEDWTFLAALQEKVSKEPLLNQLAQDVVVEAHTHLQELMRQQLPRLYSCAYDIKRKKMYHQIKAEANSQDQKRRKLSRDYWFDEIKMAQAQANPGYFLHCIQIHFTLLKCTLQISGQDIHS